jgi:hypothetical protein
MNQPHPHALRDFIGGLLLVLALHIAFGVLCFGIAYGLVYVFKVPFFNQNYNALLLGIPIFFLGLSQVLYLIPAALYFNKKQRHEVTKGIICGGVVTLLLNGSCFGIGMGGGIVPIAAIGLSLVYIGLMLNQRWRG